MPRFPYTPPNYDEAKRVVLGIIQVNGGAYNGRTRLYKVFYDAHLFYWRKHGKYLTTHPIVHMTNGPGIDKGPEILDDLARENKITQGKRPVGPFTEDVYVLSQNTSVSLTESEREAIESAIEWVGTKSAAEISRESHERSRTWRANSQENVGSELHYCLDSLSEACLDRTERAVTKAGTLLDDLFPPFKPAARRTSEGAR